jgi:hypothetical protein
MIPQISTPTADLAQTYAPDTASGIVTVELGLSPDGDLGAVAGIDRLAQDVTKFLYTPVGADPMNPDYGNALWGDIGQPQVADPALYAAALDASLADFAARQEADAASGLLATDEQLDHWEQTGIALGGGTLTIGLRLFARSGEETTAAAAVAVATTSA